MQRYRWVAVLGLLWLMGWQAAQGQPGGDARAALDLTSGPRPGRGWSMRTVHRQFGEPIRRLGPVGKPPITQWVYPDFAVYFEHQHTIHAVWTAPSSRLSQERETQGSTLQAP